MNEEMFHGATDEDVHEAMIERARARRLCLSCGKVFVSEGPWNRRCPACVRKWDCYPRWRDPSLPHRVFKSRD